MQTTQSFLYYAIAFPPFCQNAVKQTEETYRPFKRFDLTV